MNKNKETDEIMRLRNKIREQAAQLKELQNTQREAIQQTSAAVDAVLAEVAVCYGEPVKSGDQKSWKLDIPVPKAGQYQVQVTRNETERHYYIEAFKK